MTAPSARTTLHVDVGAGTGADEAGGSCPAGFASARAVADAVLYEGYLLYPYRRSSGKNRMRWQFGVLAPRRWVEAGGPVPRTVAGSTDAWCQQTDCLLELSPTASVVVRLRFLQLQRRSVEVRGADGAFGEVDALKADGAARLSFDEAVPREAGLTLDLADLADLADPAVRGRSAEQADRGESFSLSLPGGMEIEPLDDRGNPAGRDVGRGGAARVVRRRWPVSATVRVSVTRAAAPFRLYRLRLVVENTVADVPAGAARPMALRRSMIATHSLLGACGGRFLSLLDPPTWAAGATRECENIHTFPVLAGADGAPDVMLSSPIILYDHPRIAPESPGDLFDATEIDEILSLRTLALTDDEKHEARATDRRAAEIIDRVDGIPRDTLARLHGAVRSLRPVPSVGAAPAGVPVAAATTRWWEPEADRSVRPDSDSVSLDGVMIAKGSRVRLHPRDRGSSCGSDAHDMFLRGREARVQAVFLDVDGAWHVAVSLDDDPAAELHRWYGRHYYFAPEELAPLTDGPGAS